MGYAATAGLGNQADAHRLGWGLWGMAIATVLWSQQVGATSLADVNLHGFVSQGYLKSTHNNYLAESKPGTFAFTEAGLTLSLDWDDAVRVGLQLFGRSLGELGHLEMQVDWAVVEYRIADWLQLRAGRIKVPFGLRGEARDVDAARIPALLPQSVYDETLRGALLAAAGFAARGVVPMALMGEATYDVLVGQPIAPRDNMLGMSVASFGCARLIWSTPLPQLRLAGTYVFGDTSFVFGLLENQLQPLKAGGLVDEDATGVPATVHRLRVWVASAEYFEDPIVVTVEYNRWQGALETPFSGALPLPDELDMERVYASVAGRFWPWFQMSLYYSVYFFDASDRAGERSAALVGDHHNGWQKDLALTVRSDVTDNLLVKLEAHQIDGTAHLIMVPHLNPGPEPLRRRWALFLAKVTLAF